MDTRLENVQNDLFAWYCNQNTFCQWIGFRSVLGFEKPEFDDGAWGGMPVPGNWELNGRLGLLGLDNGMANGIIKRRCCAEQTYADLAVKSPPLRHC